MKMSKIRLLIFLRLFIRISAFSYPLLLTVMYNFLIFGKLPGLAWTGYVAFMSGWELLMGVANNRPSLKYLLTVYVVLAVVLEFPGVLLSGISLQTVLVFLSWVIFWYGSLLLLGFILIKQTMKMI
ncbi:hypothetical protein [Thermococcus sp. AM4]|uniref:hypothetical protein n=1 Tax=Thermococcus sp. (strain AM4) TaxID=246969 RepID=UPI0011D2B862|nr:hypothetical protein [Thermococcus sp. AM4]